MKSVCAVAMMTIALTGCALKPLTQGYDGGASCSATPDKEHELNLNLARQMVDEGRLYAALANLQGMAQDAPEVRLAEAKIMRKIGRPEAQALYQSLAGTCLAGAGEHGLGQLAVASGDTEEGLQRMQTAARMLPTDAQVRNDLGVVLMHLGRTDEARFEFLTAIELSRADTLPALNLTALMFYENKWQEAGELASRFSLSADQVREAEARARELRGNSSAPVQLGDNNAAQPNAVAGLQQAAVQIEQGVE